MSDWLWLGILLSVHLSCLTWVGAHAMWLPAGLTGVWRGRSKSGPCLKFGLAGMGLGLLGLAPQPCLGTLHTPSPAPSGA